MCSAARAAAPAAPRPRPARWAFAGGPDASAERITTEVRERIGRRADRYNHPRPRTVLTLGAHTGRTNGGQLMGADKEASPSMTRRVLLTAGGLTVLRICPADPAPPRPAAAPAPDAPPPPPPPAQPPPTPAC